MSQDDWSEFAHGVALFNGGKFWHAHEAWEEIWLSHEEDERLFFQGLIQLAAAYHHLAETGKAKGLVKNLEKAYDKLKVFEPEYLGVRVSPLLRTIETGIQHAAHVDDESLETLGDTMVAKIQFQKPTNPDSQVEIQEAFRHPQFREGVRLFNERYYWEAHEAFEDAWRDQEGDGKAVLQAFVQMASGYNFLKMG